MADYECDGDEGVLAQPREKSAPVHPHCYTPGADERVTCFAVFQSGIIQGKRSGHTRTWLGCEPQVDFYDQRGYQMWLGSDMVFDTQEEADAFWLSRY